MQPLALLVVGVGNIGSYWLDEFAPKLPSAVYVAGLFRSRSAWLEVTPNVLPQWRQYMSEATLTAAAVPALISEQIRYLCSLKQHVAVLDLTAAESVADYYSEWVAAGAHLISANKAAGASAPAVYQELRRQLRQHQRQWLYNTTVGAALPIQAAIQRQLRAGDSIHAIEGVLSGSLGWLFQQLSRQPDTPFSSFLEQAIKLGYTEPDPRTDLRGTDVARKLLILAREAGWELGLADIATQSLVPPALAEVRLTELLQRLPEFDVPIAAQCHNRQHYYQYIGRVALVDGRLEASARLVGIEPSSAMAQLPPGDSYFAVYSEQYPVHPLVIQGAGAGRDITAAGVHSDVLSLHDSFMTHSHQGS